MEAGGSGVDARAVAQLTVLQPGAFARSTHRELKRIYNSRPRREGVLRCGGGGVITSTRFPRRLHTNEPHRETETCTTAKPTVYTRRKKRGGGSRSADHRTRVQAQRKRRRRRRTPKQTLQRTHMKQESRLQYCTRLPRRGVTLQQWATTHFTRTCARVEFILTRVTKRLSFKALRINHDTRIFLSRGRCGAGRGPLRLSYLSTR